MTRLLVSWAGWRNDEHQLIFEREVNSNLRSTLRLTPQAVYLENERWLRTVVRSRIPEPEAVEDIMQNIAMALVRQRETLHKIHQMGSWLYQVAVKQVLMHRRSHGRFRRFQERLAEYAETSESETVKDWGPVERVLVAEKLDLVRAAMSSLDDLDRQILMLKYTENWTYRQLAELMSVKEETVEYRLARARKRLRKRLATTIAE